VAENPAEGKGGLAHAGRTMRLVRAVLWFCAMLCACVVTQASARAADRYEPPGLAATDATLDGIRDRYAAASGVASRAYAERIETYHTVAKGTPFDSTATIRGSDFTIATTLAGDVYRTGRKGGRRWRRTPNGVVRIVASDVQGDDLDRWPSAVLGFDFADCRVVGETHGDAASYVLEDRAAGDVPHWLYVDVRTGELRREVTRDGSRVVTFDFSDVRAIDGVRQPYAWHVDGAGGPADVVVASIEERDVPASLLAIPESAPATFELSLAGRRAARLPTRFTQRNEIFVTVRVDGHTSEFVLDTGTTQMLIDGGAAHRFGLRESLDHTTVHELVAGPITMSEVPFLTVGLGSGFGGLEGILGYEFFRGYVVHVNYERQFVEVISHEDFEPPPHAIAIPISYAEGMPLASGRIDSIAVDRFALDTGSQRVVLPTLLRERAGQTIRARTFGDDRVQHYLEGRLTTNEGTIATLAIGGIDFVDVPADIERAERDSIEIPLDGIVGTSLLSTLDLWFDYDDDALYAKPF
jgi:predicted aspartyl protease